MVWWVVVWWVVVGEQAEDRFARGAGRRLRRTGRWLRGFLTPKGGGGKRK